MKQLKSSLAKTALLFAAVISASGCITSVRHDVETEIRQLAQNPGSASGSDLMLVLCGWPTTMKLDLKTLNVQLDPRSDSKGGSGTAEISAEKDGITYHGMISFIYFRGYTGGHGYSGSNEIALSNMIRESEIERNIASPANPRPIKTGEKIYGTFDDSSIIFPDKMAAQYYSIELPEDAAIKITLDRPDKKIPEPHGFIFQRNLLISGFDYSGNRLKGGHTILMVCSRNLHSQYSIQVEQLDEKAKENFIKPKR